MGMSAHQRIRRTMAERKAAQEQVLPTGADPAQAIEKMTVAELKDYARANEINISGLSKKEDIKLIILESINADSGRANGETNTSDASGDGDSPTPEEGAGSNDADGGTA